MNARVRGTGFAMRLCRLEISEKLHNDVSSTWLPKHVTNKNTQTDMLMWKWGKLTGLNLNKPSALTGN